MAGAAARGPTNRIAAFVAALRTELALRADALDAAVRAAGLAVRPPLDTVYLGGGTPTLLPADDVAGLLELIRERFGIAAGAEITIEANPGPDERGDAGALGAGRGQPDLVRRPEPGPRASSGGSAGAIGRATSADAIADGPRGRHRLDQPGPPVRRPGRDARRPGSTRSRRRSSSRPDHLSLYALTLDDPDAEGLTGPDGDHLPTRRGARRWRDRALDEQDEDRAAAQYHHAVHRLAEAGWRGYEISNWARPGHVSRHNLAYWERRPYEAVGPGAHAFDGATRRWNAAHLGRYVEALTPAEGSGRRRGCRRAAPRRSTGRPRPPRRRSSGSGRTAACRARPPTSRRSPTCSAGPWPPSC